MASGNQRGYHSDDSSGNDYHQRDGNRFWRGLDIPSRMAKRDASHHAKRDNTDATHAERMEYDDIGQIQEGV